MIKTLLASTVLLATATFAHAADPTSYEPAVEPVMFSWSGAYVGVQAGYIWSETTSFDDFGFYIPFDPNGLSGGLYAGYNHQFINDLVVGIDADFALSNADGAASAFDPLGAPIPITTGVAEIEWTGAVRARLGYAVGRILPYVAAGVAFAKVEDTITVAGVPGFYSDTYTGYTVGAGLEYAMTDNVILRGEYRFSDYGDRYFATPVSNNVELRTSELRIGISYKF